MFSVASSLMNHGFSRKWSKVKPTSFSIASWGGSSPRCSAASPSRMSR